MTHGRRARRKRLFRAAIFLGIAFAPAARAGYYRASGTPAAAPSGAAMHTIVVMPVDACYAALGKKQQLDIEMHYTDPYTECMRRLKLKEARAAKKKSAPPSMTPAQKNAAPPKTINSDGGYYDVEKSGMKHHETP
ncbi:MAG: hypothetical protein KGL10_08530 [Alphaproteobacteria bacterium]|nr:hypothetical protein [Alphaproteobacteria bacterium]